ncbi:Inner membrane ABC transporter permease protein ycjP [Sebaldella termitidis]|jgi:multiple sugar transport system permease protein|uniref:Binding-protein-dependent transport systems inner membrane component n=1 Tax=Sebaldella termitidis (strain ATCC 33386 / NCTC 11300) TaxID=526218 RepID=D1AI01_SEBTE|nr:carbohydrate ABC transporter permease [Sebaldella termitidis]ACZ08385.1 binding-protein-dependent transport systems inner membrane component [Sebaldella termitidis ATCC 33386]MBP7979709.1 carbohydrate ABC transporter permease [Sebaldella sp.]SUI23698.1 Inner membrane ABC transporter permease protein ycjP [Sebaldella termitidis]
MNRNSKTARRINKIVFYVSLVFMLFIILFPFIIMLSTSLKGAKEAIQYPPTIIPKNITFEHYRDIFNPKIFPFLNYFKNSLYVAVFTAIISVAAGIFGGYSLSKLNFMGKTVINDSFYTVYMFSGILLVVPLFRIMSKLGLHDTKTALIITLVVQTLPTSIYMLKSYFDTIPKDLEEAGMIDGLNRIQIIFKIIIPLSLAGIASVFIYCFMIAWNDYLFAVVFISSPEYFTLPIGLNALFNTPDYIWGRMMAASLVTALPVVIMYAVSEKFIRGNMVAGGVKG